jgi:hypothetical protein
MARPRTYETGSRIHLGIRYDKYFIALFDRIAAREGLSRAQAIDRCLRNAIKEDKIPSYWVEVDQLVAAERDKAAGMVPSKQRKRPVFTGSKKTAEVTQASSSGIK